MDDKGAAPVGSVDKALALIELLAAAGPDGLALREVVEASGLNKASAHRTLQALQHRGFAEQDAHQRYRLGSRPAMLVEQFLREENLPALFRPTLLAICQQAQELVHLGILDGHNVLYLDKVEPDRTIRVWSRVGRQVSVVTTALGRAMIAAEGGGDTLLAAYTSDADPIAAERFTRSVAEAKVVGYATEREENEAGICCVGVALRRPTGRPVAVSVTGPSHRMGADRLEALGNQLRDVLSVSAPPGFSLAPCGTAASAPGS
ncbi:IclR family transcriptional regulator [Mycolicibacterium cosmeticum]|uniref:IclR-family protein transcriptional regulator n=1 Tax=Mycolicibacterium cosmeticum TaxID=258533 RepID=W9BLS0_MYCCO|nr:IclR family transcriptional regulator [Mycolicibacterium cosmeticum]TLH81695.1 IclR family transcriptional regulator [Mycolicibacterium cosmeticum]CDO10135.1 IclR-family protein transcriptional regulator [Mycolicibacterium cosmeticum]